MDAVLDLVGGEMQARSMQVLKPGGRLISAVSEPDQERARHYGIQARFFLVNVNTSRLNEIASLIDRGALKARVGAVIPLEEAYEAHLMLEGMRSPPPGKIVLEVGPK